LNKKLRDRSISSAVGDLSPWSTALNAAKKAKELLAAGEGSRDLQDRARTLLAALQEGQAAAQTKARGNRRDRGLLDRLAKIRGARSAHSNVQRTDAEYTAAFREFGIDILALDPKEAGRRLAARSARVELASFLDDWTYLRYWVPPEQEKGLRRHITEAARTAYPDPWRDALRTQIRGTDKGALLRLADDEKALVAQRG
jgi:hypothetical protein